MTKREKTIKGLECCTRRNNHKEHDPNCTECPYFDAMGCLIGGDELSKDALELLKALDVTPEELERLKKCRHECKIDCLLEHYEKIKDERDALLKAQEPVKVKTKCSTGMTHWYTCGGCDASVDKGDKFCHECGKGLIWDGREDYP